MASQGRVLYRMIASLELENIEKVRSNFTDDMVDVNCSEKPECVFFLPFVDAAIIVSQFASLLRAGVAKNFCC